MDQFRSREASKGSASAGLACVQVPESRAGDTRRFLKRRLEISNSFACAWTPPLPDSKMDAITVQAEARTDFGKGAARKIRAAGRVPAVIYRAGEEAAHLTVDPNELQLLYRRSGNPNLIVSLDVGGTKHVCVLKDAQKHPVSRDLLHVDFYEVNEKEEIAVEVLVRSTGKAAGEVFGGRISFLRRTVRLAAKPADIPSEVTIDVTKLNVGDFVRAGDLELPNGVSIAIDPRTNLLTCAGKKSAARAAAAATEGEEAAE